MKYTPFHFNSAVSVKFNGEPNQTHLPVKIDLN